MLKLNEVRTPILKGLKAFTGNTVIMADQTGKAPAYPYYTIKFITVSETIGQPNESTKQEMVQFDQVTELVVSVMSYSNLLDASFDNAYKALEWFKGIGHYVLADEKIIVVKTDPISSRDTFINVDYERRHGFDVKLRVMTRSEYDVGTIERVTVTIHD